MGGKKTWVAAFVFVAAGLLLTGAWRVFVAANADPERTGRMQKPDEEPPGDAQLATFGNGCFWCTEAVFQQLDGVHSAVPGYIGGTVKDPTYDEVRTGKTGHAEVIRITYDPRVITYAELLEVFWKTHDPTTLNRQGYDVGTQYRSAVFYHTPEQKKEAEHYKKKLDDSGAFDRPIVTEIVAADVFYPAEQYHHDYFANNPGAAYCQAVIVPKLAKFEKAFKDKLKPAKK
jgi:peptide-methionine (S)-S-oxide reductase